MTMRGDEDRWIERIAARLREPVSVDPGAVDRIMDAVEASAHRPGGRLRAWFGLPRVAAAAAVLVVGSAIAVLALLDGGPDREAASLSGSTESSETRLVQFVYVSAEARKVHLVGDFNNWDKQATPLEAQAAGDVWSVVVPLEPGPYRYAFLVDEARWAADSSAARAPADDFGVPSSLIVVRPGEAAL